MTLIGRLGGVPEKRTTKNGKDFLIYKVATTDPFIAPKEGGELSFPRSVALTGWTASARQTRTRALGGGERKAYIVVHFCRGARRA